ncbi:MAG: S8 family serine peptidase [Wenzhouxiangella sp.]
MKLSIRVLIGLVLILAGGSLQAAELYRMENAIPGQYIVVFHEQSEEVQPGQQGRDRRPEHASQTVREAVMKRAERLALDYDLIVDQVYVHALQGIAVRASEARVRQMLNDPDIAFIEEDAEVFLTATQNNAPWGLDRIDQRDRPLNGTYIYNTGASNVRVYVLDSGIRASHTQFGGRVLSGATAIQDGRGTGDCNGHGTHVAGTIGASTWGVAKSVRLVPVRVFGCTGGSSNSIIAAGIDWIRGNAVKPAVANMSLGGPASSVIDNATNNLINSGVTVVVAAGNENQNACNVSPARVSAALTVGSTTSTDQRSSFSNFGSCVNLFAPGSSIRSTWSTSNTATNTISGTSMAAPHVAGVAALWLANNPTASPAAIRNTILNRATTNRLSGIGSGSPNRLLFSR